MKRGDSFNQNFLILLFFLSVVFLLMLLPLKIRVSYKSIYCIEQLGMFSIYSEGSVYNLLHFLYV